MFFKIFLWFWLATAVILAALFIVTAATQSEPVIVMWRIVADEAIMIYASSAAEHFENAGAQGVENYLKRIEEDSKVSAIVFDAAGRQIATSGINFPGAAELAARAAANRQTEFDISAYGAFAARQFTTRNNQNLTLVASVPRPRLAAASVTPQTRLLRFLAVIVSVGLVCYALALYFTAPLKKLRNATKELANGNLQARVAAQVGKRRDELSDLARDFDEMAARIENLIASQKQLTNDISHELRSPLARLGVALELARSKSNEETKPLLDRIEREANRLNALISQLLTLARIESETESFEKRRIDLSKIVEEVAADADFEARSKNKSVTVTANQKCIVGGNENLLRSAVENVVRNAVRYTPENTSVEVSLEKNSDSLSGIVSKEISIAVRDYGAGVGEDELEKLFDPFYRVGKARERGTGGIGLGLAITMRAVKAHGGSVRAENLPAGGLLVQIKLPAEN